MMTSVIPGRIFSLVTGLGPVLRNPLLYRHFAYQALRPAVVRAPVHVETCRTLATKTTAQTRKRQSKGTASKTKAKSATAKKSAKSKTAKSKPKSQKARAKPKTKAKAKPKVKARAKKVLTPEKKLALKVREMKLLALPRAPSNRPLNAFNVYIKEKTQGVLGPKDIKPFADTWKQLPAADKVKYEDLRVPRNTERALAYKRFIEHYHVSEVAKANSARRWLKKHNISRVDVSPLKDHRKPKGKRSPFNCFVSEIGGTVVDATAKWKAMTEDQKKRYQELSNIDAKRYETERKMAFGA